MTDRLVAAWREADALTADKVMTLSRFARQGVIPGRVCWTGGMDGRTGRAN